MFLFIKSYKEKKALKEQANNFFLDAMNKSRKFEYYSQCGVHDSVECRFYLLCLFITPYIEYASKNKNSSFTDILLSTIVYYLESNLREYGVGDAGVKIRMRNMMNLLNGRYKLFSTISSENLLEKIQIDLYNISNVAVNAKLIHNDFMSLRNKLLRSK